MRLPPSATSRLRACACACGRREQPTNATAPSASTSRRLVIERLSQPAVAQRRPGGGAENERDAEVDPAARGEDVARLRHRRAGRHPEMECGDGEPGKRPEEEERRQADEG